MIRPFTLLFVVIGVSLSQLSEDVNVASTSVVSGGASRVAVIATVRLLLIPDQLQPPVCVV